MENHPQKLQKQTDPKNSPGAFRQFFKVQPGKVKSILTKLFVGVGVIAGILSALVTILEFFGANSRAVQAFFVGPGKVIFLLTSLCVAVFSAFAVWGLRGQPVGKKVAIAFFISLIGFGCFVYTVRPLAKLSRAAVAISVTPQGPSDCKETYLIEGQVVDPPPAGKTLWLVTELYGDNSQNPKDHYYAKEQIDLHVDSQKHFSFPVKAFTAREPGIPVRRGRHLVVQADDEAHKKLLLDKSGRYKDTQREQLPDGSDEVATSPRGEQRCPVSK